MLKVKCTKHALAINDTYWNETQQIMFSFTVSNSCHIQGVALLTGPATFQPGIFNLGNNKDNDAFLYCITIKHYWTTKFSNAKALEAAFNLLLPTCMTQYCQDMSSKTE